MNDIEKKRKKKQKQTNNNSPDRKFTILYNNNDDDDATLARVEPKYLEFSAFFYTIFVHDEIGCISELEGDKEHEQSCVRERVILRQMLHRLKFLIFLYKKSS